MIKIARLKILTMQQLIEEIEAAERRLREDENGIEDIPEDNDPIDNIIQKGTIQPIRVW